MATIWEHLDAILVGDGTYDGQERNLVDLLPGETLDRAALATMLDGQVLRHLNYQLSTFPRIPMRKLTVLISAVALLLTACVGAPNVDFSNTDSACAQQCSANHTSCMSGFKLFPLANESSCKTAMETCAQTCPTKAEAATTGKSKFAQPSAAVKLRELDALFKDGLISKAEYEAKRQEVLKSM